MFQICRATYELFMMTDAMPSDMLLSLDKFYHFADSPRFITIKDHMKRKEDEINMEVGDKLTALPYNKLRVLDGNIRANNLRTGKKGFFPPYKAEVVVKSLKCPVFEDL